MVALRPVAGGCLKPVFDDPVMLEPYGDPRGHEPRPAGATPASTEPDILIPGIAANDTLYPVEKMEAHLRGLHHLAVSVFVFDGTDLLIQRRAESKYHCAGQWANTCCTHPHWNEDVVSAAARRLDEELGFTVPIEKRLVVEYSADVGGGLWEKERVHMFRADVEKSRVDIRPNPAEVAETRWICADILRDDVVRHPDRYTPWFRIYLNRYPDLDF